MRVNKVTIIGSGAIGASVAYTLLLRLPDLDIVLWNRDGKKAWAKAFDLSHCAPSLSGSDVRQGDIGDTEGSDIIVATAGALPREDGKRSDVLRDNIAIYRELLPPLAAASPNAVLVVVTNPVDAMAYAAQRISGFPASRVLGSGTALDESRLKSFLGKACALEPGDIDAQVIGEHGDTMVPVWSRMRYRGAPLEVCLAEKGIVLGDEARRGILERTKRAGWDIRMAGEHSCYAISLSVTRIIEGLLGRSSSPIAVSATMSGEYGIRDLCMSLPTRLERGGIASRSAPGLSSDETIAVQTSAESLRAQTEAVDRMLLDSGDRPAP